MENVFPVAYSFLICMLNLYKHKLATQVLLTTTSTGKRPRDRPRSRWRDWICDLVWFRFGVEPTKLL